MKAITIYALITFFLMIVQSVSQMSFVRTSYSVNPNYAKSVSSLYTFTFNVFNSVASIINLRIDFPNNFILSSATNCQIKFGSTIVPNTTCLFDLITNQVVIGNISIISTSSSMEIQFKTATSRYSATSTVQFAFYNASNSARIATNPELIIIQNAIMMCSLSSSSIIVGAPSTYTIQYQPNVEVQSGSVVQLQLDPWGPFTRTNFLTSNVTTICGGQCTISLLPVFNLQLLVFSSLYPSATNNSNTITLNSARNPASFAPIQLKINILANDGSSIYMTGTTTFSASKANNFNGITFDLPNKGISAINSNVNLRLILKNPLNSNTFLRVIYPSQISCSYIYGFNTLSTVPTQITGQPSGQLLLGSLAKTTITSQPPSLSIGNFTVVNPPFSGKALTITFRTEQFINSTYYYIDETTLQVTSSASSILQSGVRAQIPNIGSETTYNLWFVPVNRLISGSFIIITFPVQISLSAADSNCTLTNSAITSRCALSSTSAIRVTLDSIVNAGINLTLTVSKVINSFVTSPSSSFTIKTYYSDDTTLVDQLTSGLSITATEVPLRSVIVRTDSQTVNARTSYTFEIQSSFNIPASSIIKIYFPSEYSDGAQSFLGFSIDGTAVSGCLLSVSNSSYIQFSNLCIKTIIRNTSTLKIQIGNVLNPSSFKPTGSFTVELFNGAYQQEYLNTGITVTMTQTATIPYFKVTPTSLIANEVNLYTIQINFQIKRYSGDRVIIKFPSDVQLSSNFDCASLTSNMTISCSKTNSETLLFILNFLSSVYSSQSIKFSVQNFTNMWYAVTRTFTVQTTTNDTTYYYQEEGFNLVNYQPAKIFATINNDNSIVLLGISKLTVGLTSPFRIDKAANTDQLYILMQVPTDFKPVSNTCVPSYGSSNCSQPTTQQFNISGINDFSSTLNIKFTGETSFFENSSAFDIKLYYGSNIVMSNSELKAQQYCQSPCKQCTVNKGSCLSCLPSPYAAQTIYFSFNSSCLTSCPNNYYLISASKSCGKCEVTLCLNCNNSAAQCTSCPSSKYLFNKACMSICPDGYYSFNSQCLRCSNTCKTCTDQANTCLSCTSGYFLDYGSNNTRCVQTCTNSSFIGIENICKQCTSNCQTCSITLSNCTSCYELVYYFYQNSCIRNCPLGMYSSATGTCTLCQPPCLTCSTRYHCQSCVKNNYLFNETNCVTQCPNGYIQLVQNCILCDKKCAACQVTPNNCTACPQKNYLYQNDCYSVCPPLTYPYNKQCTRCITPCVTCASSPNVCLTCIQGQLLLNSGCVTSCPVSGYIEEDKKCLHCPLNCLACSSTINCTLCSNQYNLLQGGCVSSCPVNYPIVSNRQCYQCDEVCLTCQTSKQNCTSCKIDLFKHLYTCVQACPVGYYSNVMTYECEDGLSSKIVFFPILIMSLIIFMFVCVVKCVILSTSLPTSLTSLLSISEIAIWIYTLIELFMPYKQLGIDYTLPIALNIFALACLVIQNAAYFFLEYRKLQQDDYVKDWIKSNLNFSVLTIHRYIGLVLNFKFFRLCYSRFFNIKTLSMPFKNNDNIFPLTTIFSILNLVLCQIPMVVCSFTLVYKKILRDQLFYTSIECLILTVACAIILLIDIVKSEKYFDECYYVQQIKYISKTHDLASLNQLEDHIDYDYKQANIQGQKYTSIPGGKSRRQELASYNQLYFQQQTGSALTDAIDTSTAKGEIHNPKDQKKGIKINIFDPIKEQDQELYQEAKYTEEQIKTQAQIQNQKLSSMNQHKQYDHAFFYLDQKTKRLMQFGVNTEDLNEEDSRSMIEERPLKQKWNSIIGHRQKLARSIFNTVDQYSTKNLDKIIEPVYEEEETDDQKQNEYYQPNYQDDFRTTQIGKAKKGKRKRKKITNQPGNSELQKIYLQRLTEKKKYKDVFASSQSIKYDF